MGSAHIERLRAAVAASRPDAAEIKPRLLRLLSEMKGRAHSGNSGEFFVQAVRAVAAIRGPFMAEERMECLRIGVSVLTISGMHRESIEAADAALRLATATQDLGRRRLGHTLVGAARAEAGDVPKAVEHYEAALQISKELTDIPSQVKVLNNLGIALNYAGLYRDAIPCLELAAQLAREDAEAEWVTAKALCNLAQSHFALGDLTAARAAIESAISLGFAPGGFSDEYSAVIRYSTQARILIAAEDQQGATDAVRHCTDSAEKHPASRIALVASTASALLNAKYGDQLSAARDLRNILSSASTWPDKISAYQSLILILDEQGRPDLALDALREYASELRTLRRKTLRTILPLMGRTTGVDSVDGERIDLQQLTNEEHRLRAAAAERELYVSQLEALERLAISADLREESSGAHGYRVGTLARLICTQLGQSKPDAYAAELAGRLHDIGKISLPDRILLRPEALEAAERQFVAAHTRVGGELLSEGRIPELKLAQVVALHHHEWWNGEGYPSKLSGNRIPIHARIVALADVFDALTHGRPYAPAWPIEKALAEIRSRRGTQFDPELTDVFLNLMERLINEHEDLDAYLGQASRHSPFLQARNKIRQMLDAERENEKRATVDGNQTRH